MQKLNFLVLWLFLASSLTFAASRTQFGAYRLVAVGQNVYGVDANPPVSKAVIQPGECFDVEITSLFDPNKRFGQFFDKKNPIALVTRSSQVPQAGTASEVIVDYEDLAPDHSTLMNDAIIYGPALADNNPFQLEIGIRNVPRPVPPGESESTSAFGDAVALLKHSVKETRLFTPILDRLVTGLGRKYEDNLRINKRLDVLIDGYWLLVPTEEDWEKKFAHQFESGEYRLRGDTGEIVDRSNQPVADRHVPVLILIRSRRLNFDPVRWRREFGDLVQSEAGAPDAVKRLLNVAAADAIPKGEEYLWGIMQAVFENKIAAADAEHANSVISEFCNQFLDVGFKADGALQDFRKYMTAKVDVSSMDVFPEEIRNDTHRLARALRARAELKNFTIDGGRLTLHPVTDPKGAFVILKTPDNGASYAEIHKFIDDNRAFITADVYMRREAGLMKQLLISRFEFPGADTAWPFEVFERNLSEWAAVPENDGFQFLDIRNGRAVKLNGADAVLARTERIVKTLPNKGEYNAQDVANISIALTALVDFFQGKSDDAEREKVDKCLREYTELEYQGAQWRAWLKQIPSQDLLYDAEEYPPFFENTALRQRYKQAKQASFNLHHAEVRNLKLMDSARTALHALIFYYLDAKQLNQADKKAIDRWLEKHTDRTLPSLQSRFKSQIEQWLRTARYSSSFDRWEPSVNAGLVLGTLDTLRAEVESKRLTPETFQWAAKLYTERGQLLNQGQKVAFTSLLANSSDFQNRFPNARKTDPDVWNTYLTEYKAFIISPGAKIVTVDLQSDPSLEWADLPGLLKKRMVANESSVVGTLRMLNTAIKVYQAGSQEGGLPANLVALNDYGFAPVSYGMMKNSFSKVGYRFEYLPDAGGNGYKLTAQPLEPGHTGTQIFQTDSSGEVHACVAVEGKLCSPSLTTR